MSESTQAPRNERIGAERARITEMTDIPRLSEAELERRRLIHPMTRNTRILESFRELTKQLLIRRQGSNFVVAVCGVDRGVGSSFVSLNLASALAQDHHRTALWVQCDPEPSLAERLLMLTPDLGLMDYLADDAMDIDAIVYASGAPRMRIVPYGTRGEDPKLLGSARMEAMVGDARSRYSDRYVVLDLPPAGELEDVRKVIDWADMTVLVVPYGQTSSERVRLAADAVGRESLAGLVMNRVP